MKAVFKAYDFISRTTLRTWIVLGVLALSMGLFLEITEELHEARTEGDLELGQLDDAIMNFVAQFRVPRLNAIMVDVTALGSTTVLTFVVILFVILMLLAKKYEAAIYMIVAAIGSSVLVTVLKLSFGRERPTVVEKLVEVTGFSYPSGHSLASASIYLSFALLACHYFKSWNQRAVIFLLAAFLIGSIAFSRVYLGVHYPTDVGAGMSLGVAWAFFLGGLSPSIRAWWEARTEASNK